MLFNVADEPLLVFAHTEEIILFFDQLRFGKMIGTLAVAQLLFGVESFAAKTIQTSVPAEVDIPAFKHSLEQFFHIAHVVIIGRPNEVVIGNMAFAPDRAEAGAHPVGKFFRLNSRLRRCLSDLIAVLISSCQIKRFPSVGPVVAR